MLPKRWFGAQSKLQPKALLGAMTAPESAVSVAPSAEASPLISAFAEALHRSGVPAHRLERTLEQLSEHLGVTGQFFSTPTALFAAYNDGAQQRVTLSRLEPRDVNLSRLAAVDALAHRVLVGEVSVADGLAELKSIEAEEPPYAGPLQVVGYAGASASGAAFFGGGTMELIAAGLIGLAIGVLALVFPRRHSISHLFGLLGGLVAASAAGLASGSAYGASPTIVALAGLLILLPGFTLTVAMTELATGHLASGTARVAGAVISLVQLGFGVAAGAKLVPWDYGADASVASAPAGVELAALVVAPISLAILLQARLRDMGIIIIATAVAYIGTREGTIRFGPELGVAAGAFGLAVLSNIYARVANRPASVPLVPGILLLVPGSVGLRSVMAMLHAESELGIQTAFRMVLIAFAIVVGLLVGNSTVPPRRAI